MKKTLIWFRNDLRTHDNEVLHKAVQEGLVLPVYIFDPRQFEVTSFGFPKTGSFRTRFLIESVQVLKENLKKLGADLIVRTGKPEELLPQLAQEYNINQVLAQKEVTKEETDIEKAVAKTLAVPVEFIWGSTLFHIDDIPFSKESLPDVFTAFRKKTEKNAEVRSLISTPEKINGVENVEPGSIPSMRELGVEFKETDERSVLPFKGGENEALKRIKKYFWDGDHLKNYKFTRNGLLGAEYSSKFSPWLANGTLSPRMIYREVQRYEQERKKNVSTYWMIFELIWRDYFRFSAWKHGSKFFLKGGIQNKERAWSKDEALFSKWSEGKTGIPFIDANMRELNETGFMSNRGRQNVASFLAQNLNIDWRMGAEYFESLLLDYDPCSNYGNWMYNATVGHDPRNRYFNILNQANRYDKKGEYVRYWLSELKNVPAEFIHQPHTIPPDQQKLYELEIGIDYPKPMIDLEQSYEEIKNRA